MLLGRIDATPMYVSLPFHHPARKRGRFRWKSCGWFAPIKPLLFSELLIPVRVLLIEKGRYSFPLYKTLSAGILLCVVLFAGCASPSSATQSQGKGTSTPIASKTLYVSSTAGVTALRATDGATRWEFNIAAGSAFAPLIAVDKGVVYVAEHSTLHALRTDTGKEQWMTNSGSAENLVVVGDKVIVNSFGLLYAFKVTDGTLIWRSQISSRAGSRNDRLLISNGALYFWNSDTVVHLAIENGQTLWQQNVEGFVADPLEADMTEIQDVIVTGDVVLVGTDNTTVGLIALQAMNGRQLWHALVGILRVVGDRAYVLENVVHFTDAAFRRPAELNGEVMLAAISLKDGLTQWSVTAPSGFEHIPPACSDTVCISATGPTFGDLEARSMQDGHQLWSIPSAGTYNQLVVDGDTLYGWIDQQGVEGFSIQAQKRLWLMSGVIDHLTLTLLDHDLYIQSADFAVGSIDTKKGTLTWSALIDNDKYIIVSQLLSM